MSLILSGNSGSMTVDSTAGVTFPNGTNPQAAPSKVLQVVQATTTSAITTTSTSAVNTNITASITPLFSTSKVLIMITTPYSISRSTSNVYGDIYYQITRGASIVCGPQRLALNFNNNTWTDFDQQIAVNYLDSPATTSSTTYTLQVYQSNPNTLAIPFGSSLGIIQLMEIAA